MSGGSSSRCEPANVFVIEDSHAQERAKLMDFGLVRAQDGGEFDRDAGGGAVWKAPASAAEHPTRRHPRHGRIHDPELIQAGRLDARSDVYALGVVAYRLLTGCLPFKAETLGQLLTLHVNAPVEPLRSALRMRYPAESSALSCALSQSLRDRPRARDSSLSRCRAADSQPSRSATVRWQRRRSAPGSRCPIVTLRMDVRAAGSLARVAGDPDPTRPTFRQADSIRSGPSRCCAPSPILFRSSGGAGHSRTPSSAYSGPSRRGGSADLWRSPSRRALVLMSYAHSLSCVDRGSAAGRAKVSGFAVNLRRAPVPAAHPAAPPACSAGDHFRARASELCVSCELPVSRAHRHPPTGPQAAPEHGRQRKRTRLKARTSSRFRRGAEPPPDRAALSASERRRGLRRARHAIQSEGNRYRPSCRSTD